MVCIVGERLWPNPPRFLDTIADGIRLQQLGHLTFPLILQVVEKHVFSVVHVLKFSLINGQCILAKNVHAFACAFPYVVIFSVYKVKGLRAFLKPNNSSHACHLQTVDAKQTKFNAR